MKNMAEHQHSFMSVFQVYIYTSLGIYMLWYVHIIYIWTLEHLEAWAETLISSTRPLSQITSLHILIFNSTDINQIQSNYQIVSLYSMSPA